MTTLTRSGIQLSIDARGSGEPLVLVHGGASDARTWAAQHDAFARHFRTVVYTRRHHWPNPTPAADVDYRLRDHVDDLEALITARDLAPAHIVGHSYGALIGLNLAVRAPHLVRSLVLGEAPVFSLFVSMPPRPGELLRLLARRPRTAIAIAHFGLRGVGPAVAAFRRGDPDTALARFGTAVLGRDTFRALSPERLAQARANLIPAELLRPDFGHLDPAALQRLDIPTLLVEGQRSRRLFHRFGDRLEQLLPHTERLTIPDASHIIHEDNPAAYNAAVLSFCSASRPSLAAASA